MGRPQHVCMGRHSVVEPRHNGSTVAYDQQNWCLHCPGRRKIGKRDVKRVPNLKSNPSLPVTII